MFHVCLLYLESRVLLLSCFEVVFLLLVFRVHHLAASLFDVLIYWDSIPNFSTLKSSISLVA